MIPKMPVSDLFGDAIRFPALAKPAGEPAAAQLDSFCGRSAGSRGAIQLTVVLETTSKPYRRINRRYSATFTSSLPHRFKRDGGDLQPEPRPRCTWAIATDEPRRQHPLHGDDLRGGDPRIAAAVRVGAKYPNLRGRMVGFCPFDPRRLDRAVRHVWLGARPG